MLSCFPHGHGLDFAAFSVSFVLEVSRTEASGREGTGIIQIFLRRSPDLLVPRQTIVHCCPEPSLGWGCLESKIKEVKSMTS